MDARLKRNEINSSASHVFRVLRFVAESSEPTGVTEIARQLSLGVSTVFRALVTLEESGYIQRHHNTPRFEIGTMPHLLKRALYNRFPLHAASRQYLRILAEQTGETVSLSVRLGWYVVRIAGAFGSHDIYHRSRLGETELLHRCAEGRIILACLPGVEKQEYAAFVALHHATQQPASWTEMDRMLADDASRGYASLDVAAAPDFQAVALPLRQARLGALGSILIDGPILRRGAAALNPAIVTTQAKLEELLAADYEKFRSPFAHIANDAIRMRLADELGGR